MLSIKQRNFLAVEAGLCYNCAKRQEVGRARQIDGDMESEMSNGEAGGNRQVARQMG